MQIAFIDFTQIGGLAGHCRVTWATSLLQEISLAVNVFGGGNLDRPSNPIPS
jgi:hypothetical protein